MTWFGRLCLAALAILLACQLLVFSVYRNDQRYLAGFADTLASPQLPPSEQVVAFSRFLRSKTSETNEHYFLSPVFRPLRPTPRQVADYGGDCADRARLLVVLLDLRGVRASKWALYSSDEQPRHAVVELNSESGKMVMDGLFGLTFPRPAGGFCGIEDLRGHPEILRSRIAALLAQGERPGTDRLEGYPLNLYVYTYARTVNWNKSAVMRLMYRTLRLVLGPKVDTLYRPVIAEQPALMVIVALAGAEGGVVFCWLVVLAVRRKKAQRP